MFSEFGFVVERSAGALVDILEELEHAGGYVMLLVRGIGLA